MMVVIMGAWNREERSDNELVNKIVDDLGRRYQQSLVIITAGCDRGVGKIIKNRLMPKSKSEQQGEYGFIEVGTRIFIEDVPKTMLAAIFTARNATVFELGDEFHLLMGKDQKGHIQDLFERVTRSGQPYAVYRFGKDSEPKVAVMASQQKT